MSEKDPQLGPRAPEAEAKLPKYEVLHQRAGEVYDLALQVLGLEKDDPRTFAITLSSTRDLDTFSIYKRGTAHHTHRELVRDRDDRYVHIWKLTPDEMDVTLGGPTDATIIAKHITVQTGAAYYENPHKIHEEEEREAQKISAADVDTYLEYLSGIENGDLKCDAHIHAEAPAPRPVQESVA